MFELTIAAFNKTIDDFKKITYWWSFVSQLFGIAYLTYACFAGQGYLLANILLLVFAVVFFAFFAYSTKFGKAPNGKATARKKLDRILKLPRRLIKLITLAITIYGVFSITEKPDAISIILLALSLVGFILQIFFDTVVFIIDKYKDMWITAIKTDTEKITKPITSTANFFKKLTGQEVAIPQEKTKSEQKTIQMLKGVSKKKKAEKQALKQAKKEEKKAQREEKKRQKQQTRRQRQVETLPTAEAEIAATDEE